MFKYFTKNNTYRYSDVLHKLVAGYNNSVHSTIGIQPCKVNSSNIYSIWKRINIFNAKIPQGRVKFKVGDFVRITKEKVKFAKGYEQNFSKEIFRVVKVVPRVPQPVYELSDLQNRPIEGQFYNYELVKVAVSPQTEFEIDKILRTRTRNGIKQLFVKWKGYDKTFNSWVNFSDIKKV
jgi:hypothetical protein